VNAQRAGAAIEALKLARHDDLPSLDRAAPGPGRTARTVRLLGGSRAA
jgi:hypothetical protein